jgi:hypothetical protein
VGRVTVNRRAIDAIAADAARQIAAEIFADAVANAPIGGSGDGERPKRSGGTLANSGTMEPDPANPGGWIISFPVFYAPFVEFGTKYWPVSVPPKASGTRPFLGPAIARTLARWR